jgi:hypothetical protein
MKIKLRPLGSVTQDLEPLLYELVHAHQLQLHEVFALIKAWVDVHYPDAIEVYEDNTNPTLKGITYGPKK